jgi:hypothetical protein
MIPTEMTLSFEDMLTAGIVGLRRHISGMALNREHQGNSSEASHSFDPHILGAMGELVVAKAFNLYWDATVGRVDACDVGGIIEVKCRRLGRGFGLSIRPNYKPDKPYVLVRAEPPNRFFLVGWLYGQKAWEIGTPMPDFGVRAVPATLPPLRSIAELERIIFEPPQALAG